MIDLNLLQVLSHRENLLRFKNMVDDDNISISDKTKVIIKDIKIWFSQDETRQVIDWLDFSSWFALVRHPNFKPDKLEIYNQIFTKLAGETFDNTLRDELMHKFIQHEYAERITSITEKILDGETNVSLDDCQQLLLDYESEINKASGLEQHLVDDSLEDLITDSIGGTGFEWPLEELNISLGPLRKGDSILIGAFVDSGKTSFTLFNLAYFIKQLKKDDGPIIYVCNEEGGKKVKYRFVQSVTGYTKSMITNDVVGTIKRYKELIDESKFLLYHNPSMSVYDVDLIVKHHDPSILVIDQLWNLHGFEKSSSTDTDKQIKLTKRAREWAADRVVLNIHQADSSAAGQARIEMNQLYGSKVGMQGAVDAVITIGRPYNQSNPNNRTVYTPKNKLSGGPRSDDQYKNQLWNMTFVPETCQFKGIYKLGEGIKK